MIWPEFQKRFQNVKGEHVRKFIDADRGYYRFLKTKKSECKTEAVSRRAIKEGVD
jgi:hypothetical protein